MVTYTSNKNLQDPAAGSLNWDSPLNSNFNVIDQAFGSTYPILVSNGGGTPTVALTSSTTAINGVNWYDAQQLTIQSGTVVGTPTALTGNVTINLPNSIGTGTLGGSWIVTNNISASNQAAYTVKISGNNGSGTGVFIASGKTAVIWTDGTNVYFANTNVNPIAGTAISAAATINTAIFGTTVTLSGSTYTVTVPTPVNNNGAQITFVLASNATAITLSTPSGTFSGASGSAASTMPLTNYGNNYVYTIESNGTNWIVLSSPVASNSSGRISSRVNSQATVTTLSWNSNLYDQYNLTAQASAFATVADSGTPVDGQKIIFRIYSAAAYAITGGWPGITPVGVVLPTTTVAGKTIYVGCIYNASTTAWNAVAVNTQV